MSRRMRCGEMFENEAQLGDENRGGAALLTLRDRLSKLSRRAADAADTPGRRQAGRRLRAVTFGASERVQDRAATWNWSLGPRQPGR